MKYVVFKFHSVYMPVIVPQHVTHSQIKIVGAVPVSAGFFRIDKFRDVEVYGESESLKLKPAEQDARLLWNTLHCMPTSCFL